MNIIDEFFKDLGKMLDPNPKSRFEILEEKYLNKTATKREIKVYSKMVEKRAGNRYVGIRLRLDNKMSGFDETIDYLNYLLNNNNNTEIPEEHKFLFFCIGYYFPYKIDKIRKENFP